jgi:hypothetical protein
MAQVKGSLNKHFNWWQNNVHNAYILDVIKNGYKLPLLEHPAETTLTNNKSARDSHLFVDEEIHKLLASGVIIHCDYPITVTNALSVATNSSGKQRLVLDLRTVNPLINVTHCKYEDVKVASQYFSPDYFMAVFDLKSGYHHIDINPAFQQFMGFSWKGRHYTYTTCPFGLSSAGLIFTKVLKEMVKIWRSKGIKIVLYLDDGIIIGKDRQEAITAVNIVRNDLINAGFIINNEKSVWNPTQNG